MLSKEKPETKRVHPKTGEQYSKGYVMRTFLLLTLLAAPVLAQDAVLIRVDANVKLGAMRPVWSFFGYDEPNYTNMKDGRKLLSELAALSPVTVHVRTHNLLSTGDGTPSLKWGSTNAYTEDAS